MDFKTNVSLSSEQLADLFEIFAMTIRQTKNIKIPLGNSEMTIDLAENIGLVIDFSQEKTTSRLNLTLQWVPHAEISRQSDMPRAEPPQPKSIPRPTETAIPPAAVPPPASVPASPPSTAVPPPVSAPASPQVPASPPQTVPTQQPTTTSAKLSDRRLPQRIQLNTTTISGNGGGQFVSAFSGSSSSKWKLAIGEQQQEPPEEKKEEDLFASLDAKIKKEPKKKKAVPEPIGLIPTAKTPEVEVDEKEVLQWKEPVPEENVTNDDWQKPSELLKKQGGTPPPPTVPSPKSAPQAPAPPRKRPAPSATLKKPDYDLPPPPSMPAANIPKGAPIPPDVKKKQQSKDTKKEKKIGWSDWD
ncbi:MAG: hypothetical protein D6732_09630 [Methanobacteriota archaeon]|nr:MAG: hypothetical protein D6732_09630 [Euryarchaeota archaeon]